LTVGLVIVTFNAAAYIARCLTAVAGQSRPPARIVLFDNASTDSTLAISRTTAESNRLPIEVVASGANVGFAAANNRAVEQLADCELIATLNPDAFPEPGWLAELVAATRRHPDAASFASRLVLAEDASRLDGIGDVFHVSGLAWRRGHRQRVTDVRDADREQPIFSACAAAALYRRADWIAVGGFDERFFCYAEDVDLGFRLQLSDRASWYVPSAVALHMGGAASAEYGEFAVYHGHRNLEWAFFKNMPAALLGRYALLHLLASAATVVWFAARGAGASILRAKWDAFCGVGETLRQRRRVQASRKVTNGVLRQRLDSSPLWHRFRDRARYV
jgi:GT2 family glycosyltransferase